MTQPALSRTIQQLESRLGANLVERTSRSVQLTPRGQRLLTRSQVILRDVQMALEEVSREPELRVGFPWTLPDPWISQTTAHFETVSGLALRLARRDDIHEALVNKTIDVAVCRDDVSSKAVHCSVLMWEPRVAAVSARGPLARLTSMSWNDLAKYPLVINTVSGNTGLALWESGHRPRKTVECHNYDEWVALVAAGRGVGATPRSAAFTHGHPGLEFIPLREAPPVPLCIAWLRDADSSAIRTFHEACVANLPERLSRLTPLKVPAVPLPQRRRSG